MRLSKRECSEPAFFDEVFAKAEELFLALNNGDFPYLIPLNFVRLDQHIYLHSALEGTKLDLIRKDGRVAFSLATDVRIDREKSSTYYKSICGTGRASLDRGRGGKASGLGQPWRNAMPPLPAPLAGRQCPPGGRHPHRYPVPDRQALSAGGSDEPRARLKPS